MDRSQDSRGRIVLFRPGQFGDTLVAFPVIEGLRRLFPSKPIIYLTNRFRRGSFVPGQDVVRLSPFIDGVATYCLEDSIPIKWLDLKRQLGECRHDSLFYLTYAAATRAQALRDWLCFKSLGFHRIYGFRHAWQWAGERRRAQPPLPKESERLLQVVQSSGLPVQAPARCAIRREDAWAKARWREWGLNGRPVLAMCPGSKMPAKRWPLERFIRVGQHWHAQTGAALVVVGGPEEAPLARTVVQEWPGYGFSGCGATLAQTVAILGRCRVYCGNDTGSMHLAAIMGVPRAALFSSRERPRLWFPFGNNHVVLRNEVPCANCGKEICLPEPAACLEKTTVPEVLAALSKVWHPS